MIQRFAAACLLLAGGLAVAAPPVVGPEAPARGDDVAPGEATPVMIGLEGAGFDACPGVGQVYGLSQSGETTLAVREQPVANGRESDRIETRSLVWLCQSTGDWQGIVYPSGAFQELGDCRVGSPVARPRAYGGPCRSGWVPARYLQMLAG